MKRFMKNAAVIFVFGFITYFAVETVLNWKDNIQAFEEGRQLAEQD